MDDDRHWDPEARYRELLGRATDDPGVVGVIVFGSRGAGELVRDQSDVDAMMIVDGTNADAQRWSTPHGSAVEVWPMTLEEFRGHALPGTDSAWNRPTFLRVRIDLDRLDGEIERIVDRKRRLDAVEAIGIADDAIDGCINALYRALGNLEAGRLLEGHLDAIESLGPLLTAAFALERRVRPFNKWLRVELQHEPLRLTDGLLELVDAIVADPNPGALRAAFASLERAARATGHEVVVDSWEPDVAWLRGEAPFRPELRRTTDGRG